MDTNTAVLIYYNNVSGGVASNSTAYAYNTNFSSTEYYGPVTAKEQLPTTTQWKNVSLTNSVRNIIDEAGTVRVTGFNYGDKAARLITYQEVNNGCYDGTTAINSKGGLSSKCIFLIENTKYSNSSMKTYGPWLETTSVSHSNNAWDVGGNYRNLNIDNVYVTSTYGVRPVIEVAKNDISY